MMIDIGAKTKHLISYQTMRESLQDDINKAEFPHRATLEHLMRVLDLAALAAVSDSEELENASVYLYEELS